jgi:hypothetical protein
MLARVVIVTSAVHLMFEELQDSLGSAMHPLR